MAQNSKIEWTDHTFNLVIGCAKVSPGCASCYAETMNARRGWAEWGKDGSRKVMSESYWKEPLKWNRKAIELGQRQRVFCSSLADVFEDHPTVNEQRLRLWELIKQTPALDWQLLTKRPENFKKFLPADWENGYPNVMLGVSVEDADRAFQRIEILSQTPANKRFLSCEPLLEDVCLNEVWDCLTSPRFVDWVIVGGESGKHPRPCDLHWIWHIVKDCESLEIPVFVKQLGACPVSRKGDDLYFSQPHDSKFSTFEVFPPDLRIRQVVYCQEQTKVTYAVECKSDEAKEAVV